MKEWAKVVEGKNLMPYRLEIAGVLTNAHPFPKSLEDTAKEINTAISKTAVPREICEEIIEYTKHDFDCILALCSQGRPTADGGYENMYRGEWFQVRPVDKTPQCECGLGAAISRFRAWEEGE